MKSSFFISVLFFAFACAIGCVIPFAHAELKLILQIGCTLSALVSLGSFCGFVGEFIDKIEQISKISKQLENLGNIDRHICNGFNCLIQTLQEENENA